jgi:ribosomal protein RSM22 (predicted rRNA methylase)
VTVPFLSRYAAEAERRAGPVARLESALVRLHEGFTTSRSERAPDYFRSGAARRAYLASIAVPNAARAHHVLRAAGAGLKAGERGLDVGAGTGASALALAALSSPDSEIVLADRSDPALEEARALFAALFPDGPRAVTIRADLARGVHALPTGPFATVLAGHLLNEILPSRGREPGPALDLARALAARTGGRLVLLEPAQRVPSRALCRIREALLGEGLSPLGPCTHRGACPVLARGARDWCVADVPFRRPRVVEEVDRLLGTDRRRLTVSWLALSRDAAPPGGRVYEVLSRAMRAPGGCVIYLCGERGRVALGLPRPPRPPLDRGRRVRLPGGARPAGRDRSGAPLLRVAPTDVERLS